MRRFAPLLLALPMLVAQGAPRRILDDFHDPSGWTAVPAEGVRMELASGPEHGGMRMDFDFAGHAGWAAVRKRFPVRLPENWAFELRLRGETAPQTLEFKLLDESGQNVWWSVRPDFQLPRDWTTLRIPKRKVSFAWGPAGGGQLRQVAFVEIAVTAASGGRGRVWFGELALEELPSESDRPLTMKATASSEAPGSPAAAAVDGDRTSFWRSEPGEKQQITFDLGETREIGGAVLDWDRRDYPRKYEVLLSRDGTRWEKRREIAPAAGGRAWLFLPDAETRFLRLSLEASSRGRGYALAEAAARSPAFSDTPTRFLEEVARDSPDGSWPRSMAGQQLYWTVIGVPGGREKALLSEDGALEVGRGGFSLEPFLWSEGRLLGWAEASTGHSLERGDLPIPTAKRRYPGGRTLEITALAEGSPDFPVVRARYRIRNGGSDAASIRFLLAIRPLQVNPPSQFLNVPGGFAPIHEIGREEAGAAVDRRLVATEPLPDGFGAASFDTGEIGGWFSRGELPPDPRTHDADGFASAGLEWDVTLRPGESRDVTAAVALSPIAAVNAEPLTPEPFEHALEAARRRWAETLDSFDVELPPSAGPVGAALRSSIAWILVERDGAAIQPGSRAYARSWIRDGAMIARALLRTGHSDEVRDYLRWYAPYVLESGRVPCCVDRRGADPVPENDSAGELLDLAGEYQRFSGDVAAIREVWPHLARASAFVDELTASRRTPEYRTPEKRIFFGLLPESISHEGYSAHPVHSYWDDFWGVLGLSDAAHLASVLGRPDDARRLEASCDELRRALHESIRRVIAHRGIDYVPGSAELADLDATSTTVALSPGQEGQRLPRRELRRTFERYWDAFQQRRAGKAKEGAYTPYEWRIVGSFVRLGWRDRAQQLFDFFMADRRPAGWNEWAEVVGREERAPRFIGDMPHGWVASDFIRSTLDLFAYEENGALVLAAGIPAEWTSEDGATLRGLRTRWGTLGLSVRRDGGRVQLRYESSGSVPPRGFVLRPPGAQTAKKVSVGGVTRSFSGGELVLRTSRAEVVFER